MQIHTRSGVVQAKTNSLFCPGPDSDLNACVGYNGGLADYRRQATGFFEAGNRLLTSLRENTSKVDTIIYPLVSVYRQAIELYLKHFCDTIPPILDRQGDIDHHHKLASLWGAARSLLLELADDKTAFRKDAKMVDKIIQDFSEVDPGGAVFRYPSDTKGTPHLTEWYIINAEVFGGQMEELYKKFDAWDCWVSTMSDFHAEMKSYYGQDGHY